MKTTQGSTIIDSNHPCTDGHFGVPPHSAEIPEFRNQLSFKCKAVVLVDLWRVQGTTQKLFGIVRWKHRGDALVWNWLLFWGFLWWLSAHHFSFQSTRTNQSAVCFSFLLNSTWKSTLSAGYRMKQKMETVCCRLFTDCCWANLITDLCNSIIISLDENITDLNFVKEGKNRHNPCITVTANSAVMGRGTVLGPIH